jgi:hypothetical protein
MQTITFEISRMAQIWLKRNNQQKKTCQPRGRADHITEGIPLMPLYVLDRNFQIIAEHSLSPL